MLYNRMRDDILRVTSTESSPHPGHSIFSHVTPTPDLLNSYLSICFSRTPLMSACTTYDTLFAEFNTRRTPRTYLLALQRCGIARTDHDRQDVLPFARSMSENWRKTEDRQFRVNDLQPQRRFHHDSISVHDLLHRPAGWAVFEQIAVAIQGSLEDIGLRSILNRPGPGCV